MGPILLPKMLTSGDINMFIYVKIRFKKDKNERREKKWKREKEVSQQQKRYDTGSIDKELTCRIGFDTYTFFCYILIPPEVSCLYYDFILFSALTVMFAIKVSASAVGTPSLMNSVFNFTASLSISIANSHPFFQFLIYR